MVGGPQLTDGSQCQSLGLQKYKEKYKKYKDQYKTTKNTAQLTDGSQCQSSTITQQNFDLI